MIFKSLIRL